MPTTRKPSIQDDLLAGQTGDPDIPPIPKTSLWILCCGLCLGNLLVALDSRLISTAIPKIADDFSSFDDIPWYGSGYILTWTALQPSFGKIYTHFNLKWTYLFSIAIFEVGSILCAAAVTSAMFIGGRAVAGVGAAGLLQGSLSMISNVVPKGQRPLYIAIVSSSWALSASFGPVLGGVLADASVGWRMCFWINLPLGAITTAVVLLFFTIPDSIAKSAPQMLTTKEKLKQLDFIGAMLIIGAVICIILALQWAGQQFAWKSSTVIGLFVGFGVLSAAFAVSQLLLKGRAIIEPRLVSQRTILGGALYLMLAQLAIICHSFYLPIFFQSLQGVSARTSGIQNLPYMIFLIPGAIISGVAVSKVGYYIPFMLFSSVLGTIGAALIHTLKLGASRAQWAGYQAMCAFGIGLGFQLPFTAVTAVLGPEDVPMGNAIVLFVGQLGGAVSLGITQAIFTSVFKHDLRLKTTEITPEAVLGAGATDFRSIIHSSTLLDEVLSAYQAALQAAFILPIAAVGMSFFAAVAMEWKSVKDKKGGEGTEKTDEKGERVM